MSDPTTDLGLWALPIAVVGGAIRVGTPFLYVSIGECITERSGRVNLGLEGTLVMGAMVGYGVSCITGTEFFIKPDSPKAWMLLPPALAPWLGMLVAGVVGALLGVMHAVICNRPKVNPVAVGIAMMIFGVGLASYMGKPFIQPPAPQLPSIDFGAWSSVSQVRAALQVNVLFVIGLVLAPLLAWMLKSTRWGMILRLAGESEAAALAMGYSVNRIRIVATAAGGFLAGIGGSYLSLSYPGSWTEQISSGQGLMAVALVIFARWDPIRCLLASLLFGGVGSLGLALQSVHLSSASVAYLWNATPYVLTVAIMILTSSRARAMVGAPAELSLAK
jgi:simple sugar transport system permease protein